MVNPSIFQDQNYKANELFLPLPGKRDPSPPGLLWEHSLRAGCQRSNPAGRLYPQGNNIIRGSMKAPVLTQRSCVKSLRHTSSFIDWRINRNIQPYATS